MNGEGKTNPQVVFRKGEKIEDYYEVHEELGKGRFGKVYRCVDKSKGEPWAAKFIRAIKQKDKDAVRAEVAIMNRLNHDNLISCVDAFEAGSQMVLIMEIVNGGELFERIISEDFDPSEKDAIIFMRQICEGVQHMHHNKILHLDLKPENIMCVQKTGHRVKLIDFGLARSFSGKEEVKVMFGTPEFVAPEVVNYEQIGFATDMWSIGVICYVLLSGLSPFMGDTAAETLNNVTAAEWDFEDEAFDNVSEDAKDFIEQLLIKRKEKRLSVEECLKHEWLSCKQVALADNKLCKERLRKFVARRRWQKTANAVRAIGRMTALRLFNNLKKSGALTQIDNPPTTPTDAIDGHGENTEAPTVSNIGFSFTGDIDLSSNEVSKAAKAIQSAFRRNRPNSNKRDIEKSVRFREVEEEDATIEPKSTQPTKRRNIDCRDIESNKMDIDPKHSPQAADAATIIQAVYRGHRTRKVVLQPPEITQTLRDCEVCEGSAARFDCKIKGFPEPEIYWFKDGKEVGESARHRVEFDDDDLCTLIVLEVEPDDDGRYTCEARNCAGRVSCSAELLVEASSDEESEAAITLPQTQVVPLSEGKIVSSTHLDIVLNANAAIESSEDEEERVDQLSETSDKSRSNKVAEERTDSHSSIKKNPSTPPSFALKPAIPSSNSVKSDILPSNSAKSDIPSSTTHPVKSSLKVHLSNTNTSKSDSSGSTSLTDAGRLQERTVGGKDKQNSRLKPAGNHIVTEFRPGSTSRQIQDRVPTASTLTGNAYLKTHSGKTHSGKDIAPARNVTQANKVYVRQPDQTTSRKTNTESSLPKGNIDIPRTASSKIQDALNRLKKKSVDEAVKRESSNMHRGQGIGALTARFESPKESKPDKTTSRRDPLITSKVSDRKEKFNNNGANDSKASAGKSSPSRSVVDRYTTPGKSASLKSKFESKPEADKQPQFIRKPKGETLDEGDSVKFSCKASGVPYPSVTWQFKGKTLKDEGRCEIYTDKDVHFLEIFDLVADDAGLYTCKLLNSTGRATATAQLTLTENLRKNSTRTKPTSQETTIPPKFEKKLIDYEVVEGDEARLECQVSGIPVPDITWLYEGKPITECKRRRLTRRDDGTCTLIISKVEEDDDAIYTCTAKNRVGSISCTAEIQVEPKPSPRWESKKIEGSSDKPTAKSEDITDGPLARSHKIEVEIRQTESAICSSPIKVTTGNRHTESTIRSSPIKVATGNKHTESTIRSSPFKVADEKKSGIIQRTESSPFKVADEKKSSVIERTKEKFLNNNDIKTNNMVNKHSTNQVTSKIQYPPATQTKIQAPLPTQPKNLLSNRPVPKAPKVPEFLVKLRSQTVTEPRSARFTCLVKGTPEPSVVWTKDDSEAIHDDGRIILSSDRGEHRLEITETNTMDSGCYTCTLMNDAGNASASATLTVNAQYSRDIAPKFLQNLEDIKVKDGEPAKFHCKITASPKPTVQWLYEGKELPSDDEIYEMNFDGSVATLTLADVLFEDNGEYSCSVRNAKGSCACSARLTVLVDPVDRISPAPSTLSPSIKSDTPLSSEPETIPDTETRLPDQPVQPAAEPEPSEPNEPVEAPSPAVEEVVTNTSAEPEFCQCPSKVGDDLTDSATTSVEKKNEKEAALPEFITKLKDMEVVDGSPVRLSVQVKGEPLPDVMWIFDECEILEDDDFQLIQEGNTFSLIIREVYPEDGGDYTCRLIGDKEVECSAQLLVKDPEGQPAKFVQKPRSVNVVEGSSVKLTCKMEGDPEPSLTWLKDDKEIKPGERFVFDVSSIGGVHTLEIPAVLVTDAGNYTCTIKNELGDESCTVAVRVQQLQEEQTDFRSLLKSRPRLQNIDNQSSSSERNHERKTSQEAEAEQLDFRHVLTRHVKTKQKPCFLCELKTLSVREGDYAVFECRVEGIPEPNVAWAVNGKPIKESKYFQMSYDGKVAKLTITEAFPEDDGEYKCMASNTAGQSVTAGDLKVTPFDDVDDEDLQYNTNNSNSVNDIQPVNGDIVIPNHDNTKLTEIEKELPHVEHSDKSISEAEDEPDYMPSLNSEDIPTVNGGLQAATPPIFDEELQDEPITEGSAARMQCRVLGDPEPDIIWYKDDKELREGRKYRFEFEDGDIVVLLINNASMCDLGTYTCKAVNRAGTAESSAQLIVQELRPPKVEGGPTNLQVVAGQTLNLSCKVSGRPPPDIVWYKDRKEMLPDQRVHIDYTDTTASLVITNAQEEDAGKYNLCLESDSGRDSFAISVSVVGKPEPPTGKPTASNVSRDTLTMSWSGAAYDGGSRITGYVLEMSKGQDQVWNRVIRTSSTSHVLRDLEPDIEYLFRVSAENAHGASEPSDISDATLTADIADDVFSEDKHQDSEGHKPALHVDPSSLVEKVHQHDLSRPKKTPVEDNVLQKEPTSSYPEGESTMNELSDNSIKLRPGCDEIDEDMIPYDVTIKKDKEMSQFYDLKEQIGKGRFGVVYRCTSKETGKDLAAKFIKTTPKELDAVREEIFIMSQLHHPKLLQCVDAFETPRQMIVIMEMIAGGELFERVIDDDFDLTERDVIKYMRQICAGVQHIHRQSILHLDLKPENIMCVDKTGSRIKLIDFGLARKFDPSENVKVMFGTPEFVAPEVINYERISFATDMWSVGVICYILLSGLSPFMGDNDAETLNNVTGAEWDFEDEAFDDISSDAKEFIENLLLKDLKERKAVDECLVDKWLIKDVNKMKASKISKDNFKKYVARRRWQKTATAVRALGRMASLTSFSSLKKLNGNTESTNGTDRTPFSGMLRERKKEENAKKARYLKEALSATTMSQPPTSPRISPKPQKVDTSDTSKPEITNSDATKPVAPKFIKKMVDCEVFEGDHARFDCKIEGEPEPDITWLQDGIKVEENSRFIFDYDDDGMCSLIIKNVIEDDDAEYTFKASNATGEISCTAELIVGLL